ncbi:MaoC family dehydratase N-terminal domain-containing protein [Fredinandcohnia quinoae]|uniref:MaoC family dehydratase N-terminal domain-containing protein n=1 Tax=Fredinandcohnia quinoae TaxID=2918902 RepID=A0AAW5EB62_9BACI|nr:MaoC family dehydratase N-terminal domain-containing protein [Fredinandcohnia sp. SECRCQ15]MCH1626681.1 MaoC family dehydratase N-terminal domain-containing protein [Fredinandcohnia sp. SECRCQ15]
MFSTLIGNVSKKVKNTVEKGVVKKFAEAIGDVHPIYLEEEVGKKSIYKRNIAPPTFPMVFDYGKIEGIDLTVKGLIHGEQVFHYERPLLIGEDINCYTEVKNYVEKKGSSGTMGFLTLNSYGEDMEGKTIFTTKMVVIINDAVRKGLMLS